MLLLLWLWSGTAQAVGRSCAALSRWWLFKELLHRRNPALRVMTIKPPLLLWKQHINQGHAWLASIRLCVSVFACVCVCSRHHSIISSQQKKAQSNHVFLGGEGRENEQMSLWSTTLFLMFLMFHYLVPDCQSAFSESTAWIKLSGGFPASETASRALGRDEKAAPGPSQCQIFTTHGLNNWCSW